MKTVRRADEGIRWPREKECRVRRDEGDECICRTYDGQEGYYVVGEDRHAVAYYRDRAEAKRTAERAPTRRLLRIERQVAERHQLNSEEE